MFRFKYLVPAIVLTLLFAAMLPVSSQAQAQGLAYFVSASSSCEQGMFTFQHNGARTEGAAAAQQIPYIMATVEAWDSEGTYLGSEGFMVDPFETQTYGGTIDYSDTAVDAVTFRLYYYDFAASGAHAQLGELMDTITVPAICGLGCDALLTIPSQAVSGLFVADAPVYWGPDASKQVNDVVIQAGKTYLVIGQDAIGEFRQVLLGCTLVWVPFNSVGPNPDAVWNNAPLPTTVVE